MQSLRAPTAILERINLLMLIRASIRHRISYYVVWIAPKPLAFCTVLINRRTVSLTRYLLMSIMPSCHLVVWRLVKTSASLTFHSTVKRILMITYWLRSTHHKPSVLPFNGMSGISMKSTQSSNYWLERITCRVRCRTLKNHKIDGITRSTIVRALRHFLPQIICKWWRWPRNI